MTQCAAHKHASTRRATYQNVLDAPARLVTEIIDGTLHTQPHPALRHARTTSRLGFRNSESPPSPAAPGAATSAQRKPTCTRAKLKVQM